MVKLKKSRIILKYKSEREDISDIIALSNSKIEKANNFINNAGHELELKIKELTNDMYFMYKNQKYNIDYSIPNFKYKDSIEIYCTLEDVKWAI